MPKNSRTLESCNQLPIGNNYGLLLVTNLIDGVSGVLAGSVVSVGVSVRVGCQIVKYVRNLCFRIQRRSGVL